MVRTFVSKLSAGCLLLTLASGSQAAANQDASCAAFGSYAAVVMMMRQMGNPLSDQIASANRLDSSLKETAPQYAGMHRGIVLAAYEYPRYSTQGNKDRAIQEFENAVTLACYQQ